MENLGAQRADIKENDEIKSLYERNSSDEWIYSNKRYLTDYTVHKRKKYPFGIVNVEIKLAKDIIEDIVISGDFFGIGDIKELERYLVGKRREDIKDIDISLYIDKMTFEEFYELINS